MEDALFPGQTRFTGAWDQVLCCVGEDRVEGAKDKLPKWVAKVKETCCSVSLLCFVPSISMTATLIYLPL